MVLPALGWDGVLEGEEAALDRIGFLFTMYGLTLARWHGRGRDRDHRDGACRPRLP